MVFPEKLVQIHVQFRHNGAQILQRRLQAMFRLVLPQTTSITQKQHNCVCTVSTSIIESSSLINLNRCP